MNKVENRVSRQPKCAGIHIVRQFSVKQSKVKLG